MQGPIPAAEATFAPVMQHPGRQLTWKSVLDTLSPQQRRRIPTISAPFYSGYKFELEDKSQPDCTISHFTNITTMIANDTYEHLATSGLLDFFQLGTYAVICITNRGGTEKCMLISYHLALLE